MARLNDDGQWIILMAFIICIILLILAIIINESTLVGQTTAESVLEFSKSDIQDLKNEVTRVQEVNWLGDGYSPNLYKQIGDIEELSNMRKNAIVHIEFTPPPNPLKTYIHFNNGVNDYDETHYL